MKLEKVLLGLIYFSAVVILTVFMYQSEKVTQNKYVPKFPCISYNPFHNLQLFDPNDLSITIDKKHIREDLEKIKPITSCIRLYTTFHGFEDIVSISDELGINVILGAYLYTDKSINQQSLDKLVYLANKYKNVTHLLVGNETQFRNDQKMGEMLSLQSLLDSMDYVKQRTKLPLSTGDLHDQWIDHPEMVAHSDFIGVHLFPFWYGYDDKEFNGENAVKILLEKLDLVKVAYPDKKILIVETGWPTHGQKYEPRNFPSLRNSIEYFEALKSQLDSKGIFYNVVEAFDQPWKRHLSEGDVGSFWGIFNLKKQLKSDIAPSWFLYFAGLSLLLLLTLRIPLSCTRTGRWMILFSGLFLLYYLVDLTRSLDEDYFFNDVWNIIFLTPATLLTVFLLSYRLIEYLEQIFREDIHEATLSTHELQPFISVHVPCSNEQPAHVIACLESLVACDYPKDRFEVIVIDNNTTDEKLWKPVEVFCAAAKLKFYHVSDMKGYKSGALNFALAKTNEKAEFIAILDSDYIVEPYWLSEAVRGFTRESIAGVQYPQDYVTKGASLFQRAIYSEYKSFFGMGMVVRNRDNSIIQHGTMLLLRKSSVIKVGQWNESSIVEDADLGLRLQAAGFEIRYIDKVMGRGILPSNFQQYTRQRVRWVYGACRIVMTYFKLFLPMSKKLSGRQKMRYLFGWLPWACTFTILLFLVFAIFRSFVLFKRTDLSWTFSNLSLLGPFFLLVAVELSLGSVAYYLRISKKFEAIFLSRLAGAALSFSIMRGIGLGLVSKTFPFQITNKSKEHSNFKLWVTYISLLLLFLALIGLCLFYFGFIAGNLIWVLFLTIALIPILSVSILLCFERTSS